jgi:hypothetical protein
MAPWPCPPPPPHPIPSTLPLPLSLPSLPPVPPCAGGRAFERNLTPGVIIKLTGLGAGATQDTIGLFLNAVGIPTAPAAEGGAAGAGEVDAGGHLRFVEHEDGKDTAFCRFAGPEAAKAGADAINAGGEGAKAATGAEGAKAEVIRCVCGCSCVGLVLLGPSAALSRAAPCRVVHLWYALRC